MAAGSGTSFAQSPIGEHPSFGNPPAQTNFAAGMHGTERSRTDRNSSRLLPRARRQSKDQVTADPRSRSRRSGADAETEMDAMAHLQSQGGTLCATQWEAAVSLLVPAGYPTTPPPKNLPAASAESSQRHSTSRSAIRATDNANAVAGRLRHRTNSHLRNSAPRRSNRIGAKIARTRSMATGIG
jgi:hypothetical protein